MIIFLKKNTNISNVSALRNVFSRRECPEVVGVSLKAPLHPYDTAPSPFFFRFGIVNLQANDTAATMALDFTKSGKEANLCMAELD